MGRSPLSHGPKVDVILHDFTSATGPLEATELLNVAEEVR